MARGRLVSVHSVNPSAQTVTAYRSRHSHSSTTDVDPFAKEKDKTTQTPAGNRAERKAAMNPRGKKAIISQSPAAAAASVAYHHSANGASSTRKTTSCDSDDVNAPDESPPANVRCPPVRDSAVRAMARMRQAADDDDGEELVGGRQGAACKSNIAGSGNGDAKRDGPNTDRDEETNHVASAPPTGGESGRAPIELCEAAVEGDRDTSNLTTYHVQRETPLSSAHAPDCGATSTPLPATNTTAGRSAMGRKSRNLRAAAGSFAESISSADEVVGSTPSQASRRLRPAGKALAEEMFSSPDGSGGGGTR